MSISILWISVRLYPRLFVDHVPALIAASHLTWLKPSGDDLGMAQMALALL